MTFVIELLPEAPGASGEDRTGRIQIGEFCEQLAVAPRPGQVAEDLPAEWRRELHRLLEGADAVALRTQPHEVWVLYRSDDAVFVQNQLLVPEWRGTMSEGGEVTAVAPRETTTETGDAISEWQTTIEDVARFLGTA